MWTITIGTRDVVDMGSIETVGMWHFLYFVVGQFAGEISFFIFVVDVFSHGGYT